jgi:hypothetical protein
MAGLVPAIHVFVAQESQEVDARVKPGHDVERTASVISPSVRSHRVHVSLIMNQHSVLISQA